MHRGTAVWAACSAWIKHHVCLASAAAGRGAAILAIRPLAEAGDRRVASGGDLHRIGDRVEVGRERHLVVHGPDMCVDLM